MKILYITRKFPPSIGGMQTQSYGFYNALKEKKQQVELIAWGHSQLFLPLFIVKVILQVSFYMFIREKLYDCICLGDALLSPLGILFKKTMPVPVVSIVHGLDITFDFFLYQKIITISIKKLDLIICVSRHTRDECLIRGVPESKIRVVPNGVRLKENFSALSKEVFLEILKKKGVFISENARVILTVGRLVKRKGIAEFIENVFIQLKEENLNIIYLIVGTGKEKKRIFQTIDKYQIKDRVFLLGKVNNKLLHYIYEFSEVFVMPNIRIKNTPEGFGIVALEASVNQVPVVAFDVNGISDAIKDGENGILIEEGDNKEFVQAVSELLRDEKRRVELGRRARIFVKENYNWDVISDRYIRILEEVVKQNAGH